jgi:hypothetical protein
MAQEYEALIRRHESLKIKTKSKKEDAGYLLAKTMPEERNNQQ